MGKQFDNSDVKITPLTPFIGSEISNFEITKATREDVLEIQRIIGERGVVFLPDQHDLTPEQHIAFGRLFDGKMEAHPNINVDKPSKYPEIFELKATEGGVACEWHTDLTFCKNPPKFSILHMCECPEVGGDTCWASLSAAYDALSPAMKDFVEKLTALHDATPHNRPDKTVIHPVVRLSPLTRKKCLYVSEHFTRRIVELDHHESVPLLNFLCRHVQDPRFHVRRHWKKDCVAIWDNSHTQHFVMNNFTGERKIQRVTLMGDEVEAANPNLPVYEPHIAGAGKGSQSRHDRQVFEHLKMFSSMPSIAGA